MIDSFKGKNEFLSNFFERAIFYAGRWYKNSESAYQAEKFTDPEIRKLFESTLSGEAKKLAKKYIAYVRADWQDINLAKMSEIVHAKFTQHKDLRQLLVLTYPQELIEGNWWRDSFWGVCAGNGLNWLGRILMAERTYWLDLMAKDHYKNDRLVVPFERFSGNQPIATAAA